VLHHDDAAPAPGASLGTTSHSARGPPVEAAMATHPRARPGSARKSGLAAAPRGVRASTGSRSTPAVSAARTEARTRSPNCSSAAASRASSFATRSMAPSSSARIAAAVPGPA